MRMKIRDFFRKMIWGNRLYFLLMKPLDRYTVEVKPLAEFNPVNIPLNKLCRLSDGRNPLWKKGFGDLLFPSDPNIFHRKIWEFNQTIYGLRRLKRLSPEAAALGIGCGHEELMYFLANRVKMVYATDLYEGTYLGGESAEDVLLHPDKYAPFLYPKDRLKVMKMDALGLSFEKETFDFIFCLSSLEHFGGKKDKLRSLREMNRVLKPGGVVALTTELILNRLGWRRDYFKIKDLIELIHESGFFLNEPLDLGIEEEFANPPLALSIEVYRTPHVILRNFNTIYTSLSLFLMKPEDPKNPKNALTGEERETPTKIYEYRAEMEVLNAPAQVKSEDRFEIALKIRNAGNVPWYRNSTWSHSVRIGVWISREDGRNRGGEPARFELPKDVNPGDKAIVNLDLPPLKEKGKFHVHIDLAKEFCFWFREKGSEVKSVPIESV